MAWDLFKFFRTGNGETEDPKSKPKSKPKRQSTSGGFSQGLSRAGVQTRPQSSGAAPKASPAPQGNNWGRIVHNSSPQRQAAPRADRSSQRPNDMSPKSQEPQSFLEEIGAGQVQQAQQKQGFVEDIFKWLSEDVYSPTEFFQPVGGTSDRIQKKEDDAAAAVQARDNWSIGLGADTQGVKELSWEEYDALAPRQRAAVDANTMLVNAIQEDMSVGAQVDELPEADAAYQEALASLFGEKGGSSAYAPNTVNTLSQLGLADESGDLDEYLNQRALLNVYDLGQIGDGTYSETVRGSNAKQLGENAVSTLADTLASGYGLLSGITAADPVSTDLNELFEILSLKENYSAMSDDDVAEILGLFLEQTGVDESTLTRYFEDRLNAQSYGIEAGAEPSLGAAAPESYITPAEFRGRYFTTGG